MSPSEKRKSLHRYFAVLFVAVGLVVYSLNLAWSAYSQYEQAKHKLLETTSVLALEMDAVWDFMEMNQKMFKTHPDGTYSLYCVVAAKAVSSIFTNNSNYTVHYTNTTTRKPYDSPDEFELNAIETLKSEEDAAAYYGLVKDDAEEWVFRYIEPLYVTESCLQCHGEPAGELDPMGFPKEGMKIGDIAGVVSIVMPAESYINDIYATVARDGLMSALALGGGLIAIFHVVSRRVTRPLKKMEVATQRIKERDFNNLNLNGLDGGDEISNLAHCIESMADEISDLCCNLNSQIEARTNELKEANDLLVNKQTELKEANDSLMEANEKLRGEMEYKVDFLTVMSHELRTPLTSILAFAEVWQQGGAGTIGDEERIVSEIKSNSLILLSMVNNILEVARANAGRTRCQLEMIDLPETVSHSVEMLESLAEKKHIVVTLDIAPNLPLIYADQEKVHRIVDNLFSNAVKFTPEGGRVTIGVSEWAERPGMMLISVSDNGPGISEEDLPLIFDSFVQGKHQGSYVGGGSGLGLAVVRDLVTMHGGTIEVRSEVGTGSEFLVGLPIEATDSPE